MEKSQKTGLWWVDIIHDMWIRMAAEGGAWRWEEEMGVEEWTLRFYKSDGSSQNKEQRLSNVSGERQLIHVSVRSSDGRRMQRGEVDTGSRRPRLRVEGLTDID